MKRADIQIGERYYVMFMFGQSATCRVMSKKLFGFLLLCEWGERWDVGYPSHRVYGHKWSWKFMEKV